MSLERRRGESEVAFTLRASAAAGDAAEVRDRAVAAAVIAVGLQWESKHAFAPIAERLLAGMSPRKAGGDTPFLKYFGQRTDERLARRIKRELASLRECGQPLPAPRSFAERAQDALEIAARDAAERAAAKEARRAEAAAKKGAANLRYIQTIIAYLEARGYEVIHQHER